MVKFRKDTSHEDWSCIISGGNFYLSLFIKLLNCSDPDFNFTPADPAYSLLVGDSILRTQEDHLASSRVVHRSIDFDVPITAMHAPTEEEEGGDIGENNTDKIITNARPAKPTDGLLTTAELIELYATPVRSAYDEGLSEHRKSTNDVVTYGDRESLQPSRRGANEPEWTSYTHYWKTVLGTRHYYIRLPRLIVMQCCQIIFLEIRIVRELRENMSKVFD